MNPTGSGQPDQAGLEEFLEVAAEYRLGELLTETPHPKTADLSRLAEYDLDAAVAVMKGVDLDALEDPRSLHPRAGRPVRGGG